MPYRTLERQPGYVRCTICGQPQAGFDNIMGAEICDACAHQDPRESLRSLQQLGAFDWSLKGGFFLETLLQVDGTLSDGAECGVEAEFRRKKLGLADWTGRLFSRNFPRSPWDLAEDERGFDAIVVSETRTPEATARVLADRAVRCALARIVAGDGKVAISHSEMHVKMKESFSDPAYDAGWRSGLSAAGILFSRLAWFSGAWPEPSAEQQNPFLIMRASQRSSWLERYADRVALLLETTVSSSPLGLACDATVEGRKVRFEVREDNGAVNLRCEGRFDYGVMVAEDSEPFMVEPTRVPVGDSLSAWPMFDPTQQFSSLDHEREYVEAAVAAMGGPGFAALADLLRTRRMRHVSTGTSIVRAYLRDTAPAVPPETLVQIIGELIALATLLEEHPGKTDNRQ